MSTDTFHLGPFANLLIQVGRDDAGRCTARVVGLPDLQATAVTQSEAVEQVRAIVAERLSSGQLVALAVAPPEPPKAPGWAKDDPLEQEFLAELARRRQEDLERTLREYEREDRGCCDSSSTPTT
jgi:hypothetical protein